MGIAWILWIGRRVDTPHGKVNGELVTVKFGRHLEIDETQDGLSPIESRRIRILHGRHGVRHVPGGISRLLIGQQEPAIGRGHRGDDGGEK